MKGVTKRSILRWMHLGFSIPVLGYIYGPMAQVQQYAFAVRFAFLPLVVLSGYWLYSGVVFGVIGVAAWISAYLLAGSGAAILSQVTLFVGRRIWLGVRARRTSEAGTPN